jgi:hypothetical protein
MLGQSQLKVPDPFTWLAAIAFADILYPYQEYLLLFAWQTFHWFYAC